MPQDGSYCDERVSCEFCDEKVQCVGCGQVMCPFDVDENNRCHHCGGIY